MTGKRDGADGNGAAELSQASESYEVPNLDAAPGIPHYHAFRLGAEGAVAATETIAARTDDEAMEIVRSWTNAYGIDLWERGRLIASFPPRLNGSDEPVGCAAEMSVNGTNG